MDPDNRDIIEVLAERVKNNIAENNWDELISALPAAETYLSDRKDLLFEAFCAAGEYRFSKIDYFNSILYYNKARKYNATTVFVFDKLVEITSAFYTANKEKFIKGDLLKLITPVKMLIDFYGNLTDSGKSLQIAENLLSNIAYRIKYLAPNAIEGHMTHRVNVIVNALEKDVPMEQVKKEISKFIADLLKKKLKDLASSDVPKKKTKK